MSVNASLLVTYAFLALKCQDVARTRRFEAIALSLAAPMLACMQDAPVPLKWSVL